MTAKKKNSHYIPKKEKTKNSLTAINATGIVDIAKSGLGFVIVEGWEKDVLVRPEDLKGAQDGDVVKVQVEKISNKGRVEGKITQVIKRNQNIFSGVVELNETYAFLITKKQTQTDVFIPLKNLNGAKDGDQVMVEVLEWSGKGKSPIGKVIEVLTGSRVNDIAMKEILVEHGFPLQFSEEAMQQAKGLPRQLDEKEISQRKDCRDLLTFTIDPVDAKDFDDALSIRRLDNGQVEVGVHIADVSYYVPENSVLDQEAYERATSVYLPDRVLPMLPEEISNVLCSLRPDEDKFAFSVIFELDDKAKIQNYWMGRTVIRSKKRLSYEEAQVIIETKEGELKEEILWMDRLAQQLRKERFKKGAINFSSQEVRYILNDEGKPIGIEIKESKAAHQLIEEFMLLANRTIATFVAKKKVNHEHVPFPYRVHDLPNEEKLVAFAAFAARFGHKLTLQSPEKIAQSFNLMLQEVDGKPEQHVLEQLGIRTMAKAVYTSENIGHYGLGFEDYCHFTSPIRRYPDIMVHRIVQQCLDQKITPDKHMDEKCKHCSDQEKKAMESERSAIKYKQVEFMQEFIGEVFDAIITGVSTFGFWAETIEHKCEGFISINDLIEIDEFHFVEHDYAIVGFKTGKRFTIGNKLKIQVISTNLDKKQIDYAYYFEGNEEPEIIEKKKVKEKNKGK